MSNQQEDKNEIIKKLSNFLKLPKAQRWICCEWFYSDIDRVIFESENDFSLCLKQSFPRLKAQKLNRKQWCIVRTLIGKPRRCSDAFFLEERQMLEEKRQKIRLIQQRKISENELVDLKDLPQEIPLTLSIGHRVYTHICYPEKGVFLGTIAAVDPVEHKYRVVFDRTTIGSQTVHDYEIKSVTPIQTIPIKAYIQTYRPKVNQTNQILTNSPNMNLLSKLSIGSQNIITPTSGGVSSSILDDLNNLNSTNPAFAQALFQTNIDPMIGVSGTPFKLNNDNLNDLNYLIQNQNANSSSTSRLGGFPIQLLLMITRLNKILSVKKEHVKKLNDLNLEAERLKANNQDYNKEFQANYASIVLDLEKLNKDLSDYLNGLQSYCEEYSTEFKFNTDLNMSINKEQIIDLKKYYLNQSIEIINNLNKIRQNEIEDNMNKINLNENNTSNHSDIECLNSRIKSKHIRKMILNMTSLLLQIKDYVNSTGKNLDISNENDSNENLNNQPAPFLPFCTKTLSESIDEIKQNLKSSSNVELFEDKIQVHINHIQSVLCHYNKLHAFNYELESQIDND